MKQIFSVLVAFILLGFAVSAITQKQEAGQIKTTTLGTYQIPNPVQVTPQDFGFSTPAASFNPDCTDRQRRIRHMLIDIECDDIQPEELGFSCDTTTCEDLGDHAAWWIREKIPSSAGGWYYKLEPLTPTTPGGQTRSRQCPRPTGSTGWVLVWSDKDLPKGRTSEVGMYLR